MQAINDALVFLQQPMWAFPICTAVLLGIALVHRRIWTSIFLAVLLVALCVYWFVLGAPSFPSAGTAVFVIASSAVVFFGISAWERAWTVLYVALMPIINWSFAAVPTVAIPDNLGGGQLQPLAIVTGLVLVVRDFAQRDVKNWVLAYMVVGLALSTLTSWIVVVVASGVAFLISETVDWAVYTFSNRPLSQRVMISSTASAPLDQVVFIYLASFAVPGIFAWGTVLTGIASKLIGAFVVSQIIARQERRGEMKAA